MLLVKRLSLLSLSVLLVFYIKVINGRSNGAPEQACQSLTPKHGSHVSQPKNTNPYHINVTLYLFSNDEEFVHVEIYSLNNREVFRGFVVQARMANNPELIADGTFVPMNDGQQTKSFRCNSDQQEMLGNNTWTHSSNIAKQKVSAFWFPEEPIKYEEVIFFATIAKDGKTFWSKIASGTVPLGIIIQSNKSNTTETDEENEDTTENTIIEISNADDEVATTPENEFVDNDNDNNNVELEKEQVRSNNDPELESIDENEEEEAEERKTEPSNNVNSIVSSAFTINQINYSFIITLILSVIVYRLMT